MQKLLGNNIELFCGFLMLKNLLLRFYSSHDQELRSKIIDTFNMLECFQDSYPFEEFYYQLIVSGQLSFQIAAIITSRMQTSVDVFQDLISQYLIKVLGIYLKVKNAVDDSLPNI